MMDWPQITMIAWIALGCGVAIAQHGRPHAEEKRSATPRLFRAGILVGLLIAGGFFG